MEQREKVILSKKLEKKLNLFCKYDIMVIGLVVYHMTAAQEVAGLVKSVC